MHALEANIGTVLRKRRQQIEAEARSIGWCVRLPSRVGKPVSQEEMAEVLGVSRQWYVQLEAGIARPSVGLLSRLAEAFELNGSERSELFRIAIPELCNVSDNPQSQIHLLDALASRERSQLRLPIGSLLEIEETARRLERLRQRYLLHDDVSAAPLRRRVIRSWNRSRAAKVDPALSVAPVGSRREAEIGELKECNELLLRVAAPIVEQLVRELGDCGYAIILADRNGTVLQVHGDPAIRRRLEKLELRLGGRWNEDSAGTNAIGTALADERAIQLLAGEHYCEGWTGLHCTGAPIRDPDGGEIVGVLDLTGDYRLIRGYLLALTAQSALDIEDELQADTTS
ncbi:MAG: helix-turn-helix domain-containing protein [Candidatus Eremiobacteraeota bacterium]|nr:helix-turn-helix domain-containing protein [Candidatus Eremiobacteraeota bacterium]